MDPGGEPAVEVHARVFKAFLAALPSDCTGAEFEVWLSPDAQGEVRVTGRDLGRTDQRPGPLVVTPSLSQAIECVRSYYQQVQPAWELAQYRVNFRPDGAWERQLEVVAFSGGGGEEGDVPARD